MVFNRGGIALLLAAIAATLFATVLGQDEGEESLTSECPSPDGFFADAVQCDKYYQCVDNVMTEKLCADGMAFNDLNPKLEKCDFLFQADCTSRPDLQTPQGSDNCPRANGYFPHPNPNNCNTFFFCSGGIGSSVTCPEGLVFSLKTGTCVWPDQAGREGCGASDKNVLNFNCPTVPPQEAVSHPRYADPDDCQYFYVCINGETPRRNGCEFGSVFGNVSKSCDKPRNVPECQFYYKDYIEDYFKTLVDGSVRPAPEIIAAAIASGIDVPAITQRAHVKSDAPAGVPKRRGQVVPDAAKGPATPGPNVFKKQALDPKDESQAAPTRRPLRKRPSATPVPPTTTTTAKPAADAPAEYDYYEEEVPA